MGVIVYGLEPPKISFRQTSSGASIFEIENERMIKFTDGQKTITWRDAWRDHHFLEYASPNEVRDYFTEFTNDLAQVTSTDAERKFFESYVQECKDFSKYNSKQAWTYPALIPQVWVNWIHYDPKDTSRAERARKEPFRVDFMLKDENFSDGAVIFEIDGSTHFSNMEIYTRHLQKDRWLRKQGWRVFRMSNQEVEEYTKFTDFYYEITGEFIDIPF